MQKYEGLCLLVGLVFDIFLLELDLRKNPRL